MLDRMMRAYRKFLNRPNDAFDGAMVLLDEVVQVFVLPDLDRGLPLGVERFERGQIGTADPS